MTLHAEIAQPATNATQLTPLYASLMICTMGMMGFVATAGPLADVLGLAAWEIGLSATAGGLAWVLTARLWGQAADHIGRKVVLRLGLAGFACMYLLLCVVATAGVQGLLTPGLALVALIVTRFGMGATFSALPSAATAVIADHYSAEDRTGALGKLAAAQSSGLLFGPAFVALVAGPSPTLPLFVLAVLPLPVLLYLHLKLPADLPRAVDNTPNLKLNDPRVLRPVLASFAVMTAVGISQIVIGFVALDRFGLSNTGALRVAGLSLTAVGVALVCAQLVVTRLNWTPPKLLMVGGAISALGFLGCGFAPSAPALMASYAVVGFGAGWVFPAISAAAANAVGPSEQGRAAGAVSSAMGLGSMIAPLIGGALYSTSTILPYVAAALALLVVCRVGHILSRPA